MCYSAKIAHDYAIYVRMWGADISLEEFMAVYWFRTGNPAIHIAKAMDASFQMPTNDAQREIKALIEAFDAKRLAHLMAERARQNERLADAEHKLLIKPTKAAAEHKRVATGKIGQIDARIADLQRTAPIDQDARIYPGWYAPVMISEGGRRVVVPMRYRLRRAGKPASDDVAYPGCYNARRDNLDRFWKQQFGRTHALVVVDKFYENVVRDGKNVVLEFRPANGQLMLAAALWSRWSAEGEPDLLSFALITDEPPDEIRAAGHDRCIIPIREADIDAWLNPDPANPRAAQDILDARERPYFEHRDAA